MPPKEDENPIPLSPRNDLGSHNSTGMVLHGKELVSVQNGLGEKNWGGYCFGDVETHFEASSQRADRLACLLEEAQENFDAPTVAACKSTVEKKLPTISHHTSQLIESWKKSRDNSDRMVAKIRATLGLQSMDQFLDKIELTMSSLPEKHALEEGLSSIMTSLREQGQAHGLDFPPESTCSVSPLHGASHLFFDVAVGPAVQARCEKAPTLYAEIQPVVELPAEDLVHGRITSKNVKACLVELESCKHNVERFHQSSGWIGEAILRVRLSLSKKEDANSSYGEWRDALDASKVDDSAIRVKEVRVTQLNAYPPRPRTNVDIYTSSVFGESGLSVTLVAKTYQTEDGEPPQLNVELVMPTEVDSSKKE